jgi:hypothetical protein
MIIASRFSIPAVAMCMAALAVAAHGASPADRNTPVVVVVPEQTIRQYQRFELTITGVPATDSPHDPRVIAVDAELTTPAKKTMRIPGFAMRRTEARTVDGALRFVPVGPWEWRVRFAPAEVGAYEGVVVATTPTGAARSLPFRFTAARAEKSARGMIRVAPGNPRAFAYDDGSTFIPIGQNQCWCVRDRRLPVSDDPFQFDKAMSAAGIRQSPNGAGAERRGDPRDDFRRWLDQLAANRANWIRLWTNARWSIGIEGSKPYEFDEDSAMLLDAVVAMCEERGIAIQMCLNGAREINADLGGDWRWHCRVEEPYHRRNGGPCASGKDFLQLPAARVQFQGYLRYLVARWGASPAVFAWEFWNEMETLKAAGGQSLKVEWTDAMGNYLRLHDPYRHLITNSLGSNAVWGDLWKLPSIDVVEYHDYGGRDFHKGKSQVAIFAPAAPPLEAYGKPVLFAEVGLVENDWGPNRHTDLQRFPQAPKDRAGYAFHEALWAPFFAGTAGAGMHWWWISLTDQFDLYGQYRPLADFLADIPLAREPLPRVAAKASAPHLTCLARGNRWGTVAWVWNTQNAWQALVIDKQTPNPVSGASLTLPAAGAGRFEVRCIDPWTGKTLLSKTITANGNELVIPLPDFTIDIAVKAVRSNTERGNHD